MTPEEIKAWGVFGAMVASPITLGALAVVYGRNFQFGKFSIGGGNKLTEEEVVEIAKKAAEDAITHYKARQSKIIQVYKRFKHEVKDDVSQFVDGLFALYRKTFIKALKDCGVPTDEIGGHDDLLVYELAFKKSAVAIIERHVKKTIYQNHFPVKADGESDGDFKARIRKEFTLGVFGLVGGLSETDISQNWHIKTVDRERFEYEYLPDAHELAIDYTNELFINVQKRREFAKEAIIREFPEVSKKQIEDEWEAIYE